MTLLQIKRNTLKIVKCHDTQWLNGRDSMGHYRSLAMVAGPGDSLVMLDNLTLDDWGELYGFELVD